MVQNEATDLQHVPCSVSPRQQHQSLFQFHVNEVILARHQGELYYAKIVAVHLNKKTVRVLFDDGSKDEVPFNNIHSGK